MANTTLHYFRRNTKFKVYSYPDIDGSFGSTTHITSYDDDGYETSDIVLFDGLVDELHREIVKFVEARNNVAGRQM